MGSQRCVAAGSAVAKQEHLVKVTRYGLCCRGQQAKERAWALKDKGREGAEGGHSASAGSAAARQEHLVTRIR